MEDRGGERGGGRNTPQCTDTRNPLFRNALLQSDTFVNWQNIDRAIFFSRFYSLNNWTNKTKKKKETHVDSTSEQEQRKTSSLCSESLKPQTVDAVQKKKKKKKEMARP